MCDQNNLKDKYVTNFKLKGLMCNLNFFFISKFIHGSNRGTQSHYNKIVLTTLKTCQRVITPRGEIKTCVGCISS